MKIQSTIKALIESIRLRQSLKNGLVLVPLFFTVNIWYSSEDYWGMILICGKAILATITFFFLSSSVYLFNDSIDKENDKNHPTKRYRPIAQGNISVSLAHISAIALCAVGIFIGFTINGSVGLIGILYIVLNISYTIVFKNLVLFDVMVIATGFVLRAVAGSNAINNASIHFNNQLQNLNLTISPWLYVVTALGALFLALAKRRGELITFQQIDKGRSRKTLDYYTVPLLDMMISIIATATITAYTLYSFSYYSPKTNIPSDNSMMVTVPFVFYGIFRYLYLIHTKKSGENPEDILLSDIPLIITVVLWLLTASTVLIWGRLNI